MNELIVTTAITIFIIVGYLVEGSLVEGSLAEPGTELEVEPTKQLSVDDLRQVCVFFYEKDQERRQGWNFRETTEEEKVEWIESCIVWMEQYKGHGEDHSELAELVYIYQTLRSDAQNDYGEDDNNRRLKTEYEYEHPNYTFNGTYSPGREYEWEKTEVPSVTPSSNPSSNPSSFPTKKKKRTKKPTPKPTKKKVTRRPTPKPSKKPTKRRRPNNYPTDSPNGIGGGGYGNFLCHDGCFQFAGDGVCDDGGPGAAYFICMYGSDCTDCGPRQLRTKEPSLSPTKV